MGYRIIHLKHNNIPDWTQADVDELIAEGLLPVGTTTADITLESDWNADHVITGTSDNFPAPLTANTIITTAETDSVFTNEGAAGLVVATLPPAAAGLKYTFLICNSNGIKLQAVGSDIINIGGSPSTAGGGQQCTIDGGAVVLYGTATAGWRSASSESTWIDS